MPAYPTCPQCGLDDTYPDGAQLICPHCAHEWVDGDTTESASGEPAVRDCNGNPLAAGYTAMADYQPFREVVARAVDSALRVALDALVALS